MMMMMMTMMMMRRRRRRRRREKIMFPPVFAKDKGRPVEPRSGGFGGGAGGRVSEGGIGDGFFITIFCPPYVARE
eukprot:5897335-Pyramimonas_sp.AAC.1